MIEIQTCRKVALDNLLGKVSLSEDQHPFCLNTLGDPQRVFLYRKNNKIKGISFLSKLHFKAAYDGGYNLNLFVNKDSRGQGIGKQLFEHMINDSEYANYRNILATCFDVQDGVKNWLSDNDFMIKGQLPSILIRQQKNDVLFFMKKNRSNGY